LKSAVGPLASPVACVLCRPEESRVPIHWIPSQRQRGALAADLRLPLLLHPRLITYGFPTSSLPLRYQLRRIIRSYLINAVAGYTGTQDVQILESSQRAFRIA
jgi:hypothetical protein